ncbi:MAG TPA: methyltransferase domain-containing protein [Gemmatimonadaceae bacterium]|nr:methyltransferase domain-containing protein [Gemmatimonadaceae bacterium]
MPAALTPARRRGIEHLDDRSMPESVRGRAMADLVRSNVWFGGARAVTRTLLPLLRADRSITMLDVGTGHADIPRQVRRDARRRGVSLTVIGADVAASLLRSALPSLDAAICGDAVRLPLRDASVDVIVCSQLLHHFDDVGARGLLAELHRVSRGWVVISDLQRSWAAAGGFWLGATILRFHPITRHDGVVSVMRGFTSTELRRMITESTGATPTVRRAPFWRLTAVWDTRGAPA